jgi:hypothetical protein
MPARNTLKSMSILNISWRYILLINITIKEILTIHKSCASASYAWDISHNHMEGFFESL